MELNVNLKVYYKAYLPRLYGRHVVFYGVTVDFLEILEYNIYINQRITNRIVSIVEELEGSLGTNPLWHLALNL